MPGPVIDHEVHRFAGAGHAFMAEGGGFFHAEAAEAGHRLALAFLARHVPGGPAIG